MPVELQSHTFGAQVATLFLLAIPVACISWTITHEEIFKELHEYCADRSQSCRKLVSRKFFFALTCEFCLSHYVAVFWLVVTRFRLLFDSWQGYLIAGFSLVWVANLYMAIYGRLRLGLQSQRLDIEEEKLQLEGQGTAREPAHAGNASEDGHQRTRF